ncbi:MAG: dienelactone hydrolase family protein [Micropepsaceae bacterium]
MPSKTILLRSKHEGFAFRAYHAWPDGPAKGGLVLVQEIFGVTDHIRELCDQYAADGYDVIAPSLYDRQERGFEAAYDEAGITQALKLRDGHDMKYSVGDVQACIGHLRDERGQQKVFITGYCYGGTVSWVAAVRCTGLTAASGYYGRGIVDFLGDTPQCPIILHFGRTDHSIPMEFVDRIKAAHPEVPVYLYEAGHGFNSDRRTDYDSASAALARERTLALFESV